MLRVESGGNRTLVFLPMFLFFFLAGPTWSVGTFGRVREKGRTERRSDRRRRSREARVGTADPPRGRGRSRGESRVARSPRWDDERARLGVGGPPRRSAGYGRPAAPLRWLWEARRAAPQSGAIRRDRGQPE